TTLNQTFPHHKAEKSGSDQLFSSFNPSKTGRNKTQDASNQYRQQQNLASHDQSHQNKAAPAKQYDACAGAALLYRDEDLEIATQILCDLECHF
ncbi:hypothetical protein, partial [Schaalia turicensis]|uniref:hypothetical protein n=1 Tax=Schaalia turicensis TaxID=131111 RepID=UPI0034A4E604